MTKYTLHTDSTGRHQFRRLDGIVLSPFGVLDELNALVARAEAAEAERDELKRKLSEATAWPAKPAPVNTKVETISAAQEKASSIPVNTSVPPDWQRVRIDAAIAAMQGILASNAWPTKPVAQSAIDYSSELITELKKEVAE